MPIFIDHVVVAVNKLDDAITDYRQLGFNVLPGGDHVHGASHNALIAFQDGSYIELIAFKPGMEHVTHRWRDQLRTGEGFVDFAVGSADLESEVRTLQDRGLAVSGPHQGGRARPDGVELIWQMGQIGETDGVRMPFLISDVTPRNLRVADGEAAIHPNGATGISRISVAIGSIETAVPIFERLFGVQDAAPASATGNDASTVRFALGDQTVEVVEPGPGSVARRHLELLGSGLFEVALTGLSPDTDGAALLSSTNSHGARFAIG